MTGTPRYGKLHFMWKAATSDRVESLGAKQWVTPRLLTAEQKSKLFIHYQRKEALTLIMTVFLPIAFSERVALTAHQSNSTELPIL